MKKKEDKRLNIFRIFFQTVPILLAIGVIVAFAGYDLYFADFNLSLGYIGSFVLVVLICLVIQLFVNDTPMLRNTKTGIVIGTILTIELILFLLFAQYHLFAAVMIIISMEIFSLWLNDKIIRINKKKRVVTKELEKQCHKRSNSLVAYLFCIVLIIPACIGTYEEYYKDSLSSEDWVSFMEWFNEANKENEQASMPYEDKIVDLRTWDTLDVAEKERIVRAIALIEKEELGISSDVEIILATEKMSDGKFGYYRHSPKKEIYINYKHLNEGDVEDVLKTIIHEMHHAFVYHTIENIDYNSKLVQDNYYYKQARDWKKNSENYISSGVNFDEYEDQPIEKDAREYAEKRVQYYLTYISENQEKLQ